LFLSKYIQTETKVLKHYQQEAYLFSLLLHWQISMNTTWQKTDTQR